MELKENVFCKINTKLNFEITDKCMKKLRNVNLLGYRNVSDFLVLPADSKARLVRCLDSMIFMINKNALTSF